MGVTTEKLEQSSLRDQVLAILRKGLITGDLVPGELYSASAIATDLGVSTSPVREAMLTLVNQGVMEAVRNRGFRVIPMGQQDRKNIHELRMLIEVPSMVRLAGEPRLKQQAAKFRALAEQNIAAAEEGDLVAYLNTDLRFHLGMLEILGNEKLTTLVEGLRDQTRQLGLKSFSRQESLRATAQEHLLILDALLDGEAERVEELMTAHLDHIVQDWEASDSAETSAASA
ncbi:GntR family transcriptional regulator [Paenarthrobacter sp. NPDC092416]|uniref:GntR family transcriptional regulator n=1 Tax=Paenarthrobacter sp. NPDC092416 TaxID=3364386 RepID=UPI00382ABAD0